MATNAETVHTDGAPGPTTTAVANNAQGRAAVSDRFRPDIEGMRAVAVGLVVLAGNQIADDAKWTAVFTGLGAVKR